MFAEVAEVLSRHANLHRSRDSTPASHPPRRRTVGALVILTNDVAETVVEAAVAELGGLGGVTGTITRIRVADL